MTLYKGIAKTKERIDIEVEAEDIDEAKELMEKKAKEESKFNVEFIDIEVLE